MLSEIINELGKKPPLLTYSLIEGVSVNSNYADYSVDINPDYSVTKGWGFYEWLLSNAHKYGFINRYPADKVEITGISHERWHYRYVGKEVAGIMYEENLCLEEYIEK